jgi:hypothetical protein
MGVAWIKLQYNNTLVSDIVRVLVISSQVLLPVLYGQLSSAERLDRASGRIQKHKIRPNKQASCATKKSIG